MQFLGTVDELEPLAELTVQGLGVIPRHVETTALRRSFGSERAHDDMAAGPHGSRRKVD
jgi:hypothetical protein